jgi:hypothetical protein
MASVKLGSSARMMQNIFFTRGKHPIECDYHICGHQLERVYEHKDLGVVLDLE